MKKLIFSTVLLLLLYLPAAASHIQGGHITYEHREGRTYAIILTGFSDAGSPVIFGSGGTLDFGDGTQAEEIQFNRSSRFKNTWRYEAVIEHTFPSSGSYTISFKDNLRNAGILNMENSVSTPFYIETSLIVDDMLRNNSVKLTSIPAHQAYLQQTYYYNPGAVDPDGDSLSYHLIHSLQDKGTPVAEYTFPHLAFEREGGSETGEAAYFTINPVTGEIIWDSPVRIGEYNITYEIREWRQIEGEYLRIGSVMHDLLVVVNEEPSPGLELIFPDETNAIQLEQGIPWEANIRAVADNPEDTVVLMFSGDLLQQSSLQVNPADSIGSKGEASATVRFTATETGNRRHQLIAQAYIYSEDDEPGTPRARAAYLLAPGFISRLSDLPIKSVRVYPNPASSHGFFLDYGLLNGKEVSISLFTTDGSMVYHQTIPRFSTKEIIVPGKNLMGHYLLVIRQGKQLYTSRILFLD